MTSVSNPSVRTADDLRGALTTLRQSYAGRLGEILISRGLISPEQLAEALEHHRQEPGQHLGQWLVANGALKEEQLTETLAEQLGVPRVRLTDYEITPEIAALVPDDLALRANVVPLAMIDNRLVVATANPFDDQAAALLRFHTGHPVDLVLASMSEIGHALNRYYAGEAQQRAEAELYFQNARQPTPHPADPARDANRKPVVQLVNALILQAIHLGASDLNIRPGQNDVSVHYRVDGRLRLARTLQKNLLPALVARIKITGGMDIAERRRPQDGHARVSVGTKEVDLRLSVIPTVNGESVVIRILDKQVGVKRLEDLGFSDHDLDVLRELISFPHGMILITGPTGSGKSTTLYALLQQIQADGPHTITVEDPVEYAMEGIEQIQVNAAIGYTFAEALRHILRHDPDVIMIGEIRDLDTARIANKAALTGHLVLSTLHTNDAASAVTRLIDMGVEPYLLSSTLIGVMAQRLIRLNCPHCLAPEDVPTKVRESLGVSADEVFFAGRGCQHCDFVGYRGRILVYELLPIRAEMAGRVAQGANASTIKQAAVTAGMVPLTRRALQLARDRRTSLAEVYEVRLE